MGGIRGGTAGGDEEGAGGEELGGGWADGDEGVGGADGDGAVGDGDAVGAGVEGTWGGDLVSGVSGTGDDGVIEEPLIGEGRGAGGEDLEAERLAEVDALGLGLADDGWRGGDEGVVEVFVEEVEAGDAVGVERDDGEACGGEAEDAEGGAAEGDGFIALP